MHIVLKDMHARFHISIFVRQYILFYVLLIYNFMYPSKTTQDMNIYMKQFRNYKTSMLDTLTTATSSNHLIDSSTE